MGLLEKFLPALALKNELARAEIERVKYYRKTLESLPSFAKDNDEETWKLTSGGTDPELKGVYNEEDTDLMIEQARIMYYTNPDAYNIIETFVSFIVGKEARIEVLDESEIVKEYWEGIEKKNCFDERMKEWVRRALRDGNMLLRRFMPSDTENDFPDYRFLDPRELKNPVNSGYDWGDHSYGIECDPDDIEKPRYYYRQYTVNNTEKWERIPADEIVHVKIKVDSDVKMGVSFLVGIGKYIKQYENWLQDRIYLNKIRSAFNLIMKPQGGITPTTLKDQFNDTTRPPTTGGTAKKRLPKPGSVLIAQGVDYEFANLNLNASDTAQDGRAIELMLCKGTQLAEYIVRGDASNANYSSTMVSESPMVKAFEGWQNAFEKGFKELFRREIKDGIKSGRLPTKSTKTIIKNINPKDDEENPGYGKMRQTRKTIETNTECKVNFALLIHRDIKAETEALAVHTSQKWCANETAASKLGYDPQEERERIDREEREERKRMEANNAAFIQQNNPNKPMNPELNNDDDTDDE